MSGAPAGKLIRCSAAFYNWWAHMRSNPILIHSFLFACSVCKRWKRPRARNVIKLCFYLCFGVLTSSFPFVSFLIYFFHRSSSSSLCCNTALIQFVVSYATVTDWLHSLEHGRWAQLAGSFLHSKAEPGYNHGLLAPGMACKHWGDMAQSTSLWFQKLN